MLRSWAFLLAVALLPQRGQVVTTSAYEQSLLKDRAAEDQELKDPHGWLSLVALQPLLPGDLTVGTAAGSNLRLQHGAAHAFTLHVQGKNVTLLAVDPTVMLLGKPAYAGEAVPFSQELEPALRWSSLWAATVERTGDQLFLRVGDERSPGLQDFHPARFFPVNPAYRITARWVPYLTAHPISMGTAVGGVLHINAVGYAEFTKDGQTVRLDGMDEEDGNVGFIFRDATAATTTYGAGRHLDYSKPSNGLKTPGTVILDFNLARNWPCAYTNFATCPLAPRENRFSLPLPAGERRYHD